MGDGIPEPELRDAEAAGAEFRQNPPLVEAVSQPTSHRLVGSGPAPCEPGSQARLTDWRTLLYKAANESSAVLAELDSNVLVTIESLEPSFIRVRLVDGTGGYIRLFAGLTPLHEERNGNQDEGAEEIDLQDRRTSPLVADEDTIPEIPFRLPGTQFRLTDQKTPLYAKPDGWSEVVQQISSGTVVTFYELVGSFARVATDRTAGYIPAAADAEEHCAPASGVTVSGREEALMMNRLHGQDSK
jgi:hypothetical protein